MKPPLNRIPVPGEESVRRRLDRLSGCAALQAAGLPTSLPDGQKIKATQPATILENNFHNEIDLRVISLGVVLSTGSPPFLTPWTARNKLLFYLHAISMPQTCSMAKASIYEGLAGLAREITGIRSPSVIQIGSKCPTRDRYVMALRSPFGRPSPRFHNAQGSRRHCGNPITGQNDFHFLSCRKACPCRKGLTLSGKAWGSLRYPGAERAAPSDADLAVVRRCFKNPSAWFPLGRQPSGRPNDQVA